MTREEVKAYLQITWSDPDTDNRLDVIIGMAKALVESYAGGPVVFDGLPKQLALEYCRYSWSGAADDFAKNYRSELIALRAMYQAQRGVSHD